MICDRYCYNTYEDVFKHRVYLLNGDKVLPNGAVNPGKDKWQVHAFRYDENVFCPLCGYMNTDVRVNWKYTGFFRVNKALL